MTATDRIIKVNPKAELHSKPAIKLLGTTSAKGNSLLSVDNAIMVNKEDLPLTLSYGSTSYRAENARYSYHLNYDGKNASQWNSTDNFIFDPSAPGRYTLVSKYVDEIYCSKFVSEPLVLELKPDVEVKPERASFIHIPFIGLSLLLLWFLSGVVRRAMQNG